MASGPNPLAPQKKALDIFVSFIIPALNEEKHIGACLKSIRQLETAPNISGIEVIVVDNHSSDRTAVISQELGAKVLKVAPGHPSRARNVGATEARGDWLAFVDADCELASNWIVECASNLNGEVKAVAVGCPIAMPEYSAPWVERRWHEISHDPTQAEPRRVRWLPSFNLLVARSAFERVGGFDETLATCEDCDLGYKLAALGPLILDSRTCAAHLGSSGSLWEFFRREAWRSRGNLRLALRRPFDWSNWLSLLMPPCLVLGFLISIAATIAAIRWRWPIWPELSILALVALALAFLTLRKSRPTSLVSFLQRTIVFGTYLAGRTAGLCWPFQRVDR